MGTKFGRGSNVRRGRGNGVRILEDRSRTRLIGVEGPKAKRRPVEASSRPPLTVPAEVGDRVTVTISSYRDPPGALRRAVESILAQTYENFKLVVCSDGDPKALREIEDLEDPRIVVHALEANRGQFYAHDVVLRATDDPFFAIQDGDDVSPPRRLERQVELLVAHKADMVVNALRRVTSNSRHYEVMMPPTLHPQSHPYQAPGSHVGMYRTPAVLAVGGYYNGFRMGYDAFVVGLVHAFGRTVATQEVLYHRYERAQSMTNKPSTGMYSALRKANRERLVRLRQQVRGRDLEGVRALLGRHMDVDLAKRAKDVQAVRAKLLG